MKGFIKKLVPVVMAAVLVAGVAFPGSVYAKAQTHNVTFIYGTKVITQQVKHGGNAVIPADTAVPGYAFVGWIGDATKVTEDRTILGAYNKDTIVTYATPDANVVVSKFGLPVFQPAPTTKINTNKSAEFPAWWKDLNIPKGVPGKTCAVHFYNGWNGEYWKTEFVPYGGSCKDPGNPCIAGFDFIGWEGDWTNVTEDRCIKAWYHIYHVVTFKCGFCGDVIETQRIQMGDNCRSVSPHHDHDRSFKEWSGQTTNITRDGVVYAVYDEDTPKKED